MYGNTLGDFTTLLRHIYIDESGDLGEKGTEHLVLAALVVDKPPELDRIIKNMRRNKFKKELKKANEIKANSSSEKVRKHMLEQLTKVTNAKVFYIVLKKSMITSTFLKGNKHKLYNYVAGDLAGKILLNTYNQSIALTIKIDKSKGKQFLIEDFNSYFVNHLKIKENNIVKIDISHSYSHAWAGLQFADCLSWACFQAYEHNNHDYLDIIKIEKILSVVWKDEK